ncbi:hypothetical protein [Bergeyella zoohelcum]|uniref:hypothetical protein n=1 Tax=Bergeyella zoohelcum TaxID=1015 RepID=UPI0037365BE5
MDNELYSSNSIYAMVKNIVILIFVVILLSSCVEKPVVNMDNHFGFENLSDSYDSKTQTFKRRYSDDTIVVKIALTSDEKVKILNAFVENNFHNLPDELDCTSTESSPVMYDKLILQDKVVTYIYNAQKSYFCSQDEEFTSIYDLLVDIVNNKKEIKELLPADIYYE